jgi:hypothetical protein
MLVQVQQEETQPKTIKRFVESIADMLKELQDQQAQHQAISDQMMAQCKEEEEFRNKEIQEAKDAADRAAAAKAKCEESLTNAQKDEVELLRAQDSYTTERTNSRVQRENEHAAYDKRRIDFEQALGVIERLKAYANEKLGLAPAAFAETSSLLLKSASKLRKMEAVVPVLIALASKQNVAGVHNEYKFDASGKHKLATAIQNLHDAILKDHETNETNERNAQAAWEAYDAKLGELLNTIQENLDKTKQQITDMTNCVTNEAAIFASASSKDARNAGLLESAQNMCNDFAAQFIEATRNRLEEIQTIKEILEIIQKRFGKLPGDLLVHLENVEHGWAAYVNSTAFQEYVQYDQQHTADNAHGKGLSHDAEHHLAF